MKRLSVVLLVVALALAVAAVVWAQERGGPMMAEGEEMAVRGIGPMGPVAIAVSGNDIYVVARGLLLKYNPGLDLVAQTELPMGERPAGFGPGGGRGGRRGDGMRGGRGGGHMRMGGP